VVEGPPLLQHGAASLPRSVPLLPHETAVHPLAKLTLLPLSNAASSHTQRATCNVPFLPRNVLRATCLFSHATCNVQRASSPTQRATCNVPLLTRKVQRASSPTIKCRLFSHATCNVHLLLPRSFHPHKAASFLGLARTVYTHRI